MSPPGFPPDDPRQLAAGPPTAVVAWVVVAGVLAGAALSVAVGAMRGPLEAPAEVSRLWSEAEARELRRARDLVGGPTLGLAAPAPPAASAQSAMDGPVVPIDTPSAAAK